MNKITSDNLFMAFKMMEAGANLEEILIMFPQDKKEIREIFSLVSSIKSERNRIEVPPKEILQEILEKNRVLNEVPGRSFMQEIFNKIINDLNFMNQKLKYSISAIGIIMLLTIGFIAFKSNNNGPGVIATNPKTKTTNETRVATTTPVIGNKEVDNSVNEVIDEVLNENNLDSELAEVELALADEAELDQINNLVNENEL